MEMTTLDFYPMTESREIGFPTPVQFPPTVELVDWSHGEIFTRTVKGKPRSETRYPVTCADCGDVRLLKRADIAKLMKKAEASGEPPICGVCQRRNAGAKGWQVTMSRYGAKCAVRHQQQHQIAHPSSLERAIMLLLEDMHQPYVREYWFEDADGHVYLLDFVCVEMKVIEVNGAYVHSLHPDRDARKLEALRAAGFDVLVIEEADIRAGRAESMIVSFLSVEVK
jgi:hypothetical protein